MADEEEGVGNLDARYADEVAAREKEVERLLQKKDKINALITALSNPPVSAKDSEIKVNILDI